MSRGQSQPAPGEDPLAGFRSTPDPRDPRADRLLHDSVSHAGTGEEAESHDVGGAAKLWRIVGVPYDGGVPRRVGARLGPDAIRAALPAFTPFDGRDSLRPIEDLGDLALPASNGAEAHRQIEAAARTLFETHTPVVFLGGDHGCTGSIIRGLAAARPDLRLAIVTVDAHLDVREVDDDSSISSGTPFRRALETPIAAPDRVAMIGIRPFANSAYYTRWARQAGVHLFSVDDITERGATTVAREALQSVATDADAIYLSIDLDAADAAFAPGVSALGTGGLSSREMIEIVGVVAGLHSKLVAVDIMELAPPYDIDGRTARLAARLLLEAMRS